MIHTTDRLFHFEQIADSRELPHSDRHPEKAGEVLLKRINDRHAELMGSIRGVAHVESCEPRLVESAEGQNGSSEFQYRISYAVSRAEGRMFVEIFSAMNSVKSAVYRLSGITLANSDTSIPA